jgi:G3E family GTPase
MERTPVTLITGWLGAGKTTLLNHVLSNKEGWKAAVIVNDIGEVNIDAELIAHGGAVKEEGLVALQNGCICCSLKDDLVEQLCSLLAQRRFDGIIIEASGICEPMPIAQAICSDPALQKVCRLDGIITVVDALRMADEFLSGEALLADMDDDDIAALLVQQIEFCSTIVLNKASEVTDEQRDMLRAVIRRLQPEARILETDFGRVAVENILETRSFDFARVGRSAGWLKTMQRFDELQAAGLVLDEGGFIPAHDHAHDHSHCDHEHGICHCGHHHAPGHSHGEEYGIGAFVYLRRPGFDPQKFSQFIEMQWPQNVIRCKGIVWFSDDRTMSWLFEQAGKQVTAKPFGRWLAAASAAEQREARAADPNLDENWDDQFGDRMIKLVFIGRYMDKDAICAELDKCLID